MVILQSKLLNYQRGFGVRDSGKVVACNTISWVQCHGNGMGAGQPGLVWLSIESDRIQSNATQLSFLGWPNAIESIFIQPGLVQAI
jgi:hypothetical protein